MNKIRKILSNHLVLNCRSTKKWTSGTCGGGGGGGGVSAPISPLLPMGLLFEGDMRRSREKEFTYTVFVSSCCVKIETKMAA